MAGVTVKREVIWGEVPQLGSPATQYRAQPMAGLGSDLPPQPPQQRLGLALGTPQPSQGCALPPALCPALVGTCASPAAHSQDVLFYQGGAKQLNEPEDLFHNIT